MDSLNDLREVRNAVLDEVAKQRVRFDGDDVALATFDRLVADLRWEAPTEPRPSVWKRLGIPTAATVGESIIPYGEQGIPMPLEDL